MLQVLCVIVPSEDSLPAFKDYVPVAEATAPSPAAAAASKPPPTEQPSMKPVKPSPKPVQHKVVAAPAAVRTSPSTKAAATPYAKMLAADRGIDLTVRH